MGKISDAERISCAASDEPEAIKVPLESLHLRRRHRRRAMEPQLDEDRIMRRAMNQM